MTEQVDVVVLGMGPGGEEVAGRLADAGLQVVGVERELVGGECPYWGCVPTKMMVRAAGLLAEARRVEGVAGTAHVQPDWAPVAARIRSEATDSWDDTVAAERFVSTGGRLVRGTGRLVAPGIVAVGDTRIEARAVVVATGSAPVEPPIPGLAGSGYWTNRQAVMTESVPASLTVIGGGAIGVELAQVFARFGSRVTVVEAADQILPAEEPEAAAVVAEALEADGIDVVVGVSVAAVEGVAGSAFVVVLADGRRIESDRLLVATGRRADPQAAGLDVVGIDADARWVPVDEHMRVAPGIWAVGDITGHGQFTHVAVYQARIAVASILARPRNSADYRALPRVTFTDPELGTVGLTRAGAEAAGLRVRTGTASVSSSARGWIHHVGNTGLVTLVADADQGVLVGATSVGPAGGEVLGLLALAVHARVPIEQLATMIYAYPTFHRTVEDAVGHLLDG